MKTAKEITVAEIRRLIPRDKKYKVNTGGGLNLYVYIYPSGKKTFVWEYTAPDGKRKNYTIGPFPLITLAQAREKTRELKRQLILNGIDPAKEKRKKKERAKNTFEHVAVKWLTERLKPTVSAKRFENTASRLSRLVFPFIGDKPLEEVKIDDLRRLLDRIIASGHTYTAHEIKGIIHRVFQYAQLKGWTERDPTLPLTGYLPPHKGRNLPMLHDPKRLADLVVAIDNYHGNLIVQRALWFALRTAARPGEITKARWDEINWEDCTWRYYVEKKQDQLHIVPLATQTLAMLKEHYRLTGDMDFIFPSLRSRNRQLSSNTLNVALRTMGFGKDEICAHGFRATFVTHVAEYGAGDLHIDLKALDRQLSHQGKTKKKVAEIYQRAEFLALRRQYMQWWADYLDSLAKK